MLEQTRPTSYRATPVERHKDIGEQQAAEWVVVNLTSRLDKIVDCRPATATPVDLRPRSNLIISLSHARDSRCRTRTVLERRGQVFKDAIVWAET